MAMSPRKKLAMGKEIDETMKPAVKLRAGGMVTKMSKGGKVKKMRAGGMMMKKDSM